MPNGLTPVYSYKPPLELSVPVKMRGLSTRRGRLFAGGTYFRSIDPGRTANNITVQMIKENNIDYLIVTNRNLQFDENVRGPAGFTTKILDLTGSNWSDLILIDQLNGTPRAQQYSISCSIAIARQNGQPYTLPAPIGTSTFTFGKLFSVSGKTAVKIEKSAANLSSSDVISIAPRFKIYQLLALTIDATTDPVTLTTIGPFVGTDIADMRTQVNAAGTWIEMLERSGDAPGVGGGPATPAAVKFDVQDEGVDDPVGAEFAETNLTGGDGLPDTPTIEKTGPSRSIVFINYGELHDGTLGETNTVYEWVGSDALAGEWKAY